MLAHQQILCRSRGTGNELLSTAVAVGQEFVRYYVTGDFHWVIQETDFFRCHKDTQLIVRYLPVNKIHSNHGFAF